MSEQPAPTASAVASYVYSLIRTVVPMIVGFLVTIPGAPWVISALGTDSASAQRDITAATTFMLAFLYYALVRLLEAKWPQLGVLLGVPKAPTYADPLAPAVGPVGPADVPSVLPDPGAAAETAPVVSTAVTTVPNSTVPNAAPSSSSEGISIVIPKALTNVTITVNTVSAAPAEAPTPAVSFPAAVGLNGTLHTARS